MSASGSGRVRILVVDDHVAFAEALSVALDARPDLETVGHAATAAEALELATRERPDVAIVDVVLGDELDGIECATELRRILPEIRVVVVSGQADATVLARAAAAGIAGIVPKQRPLAEIIKAVRAPADGAILVDQTTLEGIVRELQHEHEAVARTPLTAREQEVLSQMRDGHDPQTIARALDISINTARSHVRNILFKLGAHSQLEAVVIASREGLLPPL